ncbi:hypothetical protein CLV42_103336 [Chitinophaga ginsengisoli]|uniref:Uncharacterized protein n=1 Tax=Chitinophaga ginsengisoli TaxID=363837 RepID=A0A2P8GHB1_9BACT|nr:hypothetical protein CLV42_103336 [Chitinophaga ginsengisoli]
MVEVHSPVVCSFNPVRKVISVALLLMPPNPVAAYPQLRGYIRATKLLLRLRALLPPKTAEKHPQIRGWDVSHHRIIACLTPLGD